MKTLCWTLCALLGACTYEPPEHTAEWYDNPERYADDSATHPQAARFQAYLERAVEEGLPGAVLLVRTPKGGTWVGTTGYADVASDVRWRTSTIARVGSVTKMFAAAVLLKLVEQQRLSLEDRAGQYLPESVVAHVANAGSATVSQLLHHTSGTFDYLGSWDLAQEALGSYDYEYQGAAKLLEYAYDEDATFATGTSWGYSNTNFLLLELIAQRVSGETSKHLLESLVLEPLRLRSTSYDPSRQPPRGLARGYADIFADGELIDVTDSALERFHYDGGVVSNVYDLADFIDALLGSDLLQHESHAALLDTVPTEGRSKRGTDFYGCGLILEQDPTFGPVYGHSGTAVGYSAHVYRIADQGITFAAIVNASQHTMEERSYRWFSPLKHDDILQLVTAEP